MNGEETKKTCPKKKSSSGKASPKSSKFNKDSKFLWSKRKVLMENETGDKEENPAFLESLDSFFLEDLRSDEPAIHLGQQVALLINYCLDPSKQETVGRVRYIFHSPFKKRLALNLAARIAKYKWQKSSWSRLVKLVGDEAALWLTLLIASSARFMHVTQESAGVTFDWKKVEELMGKHVEENMEKCLPPHRLVNWKTSWKAMTTVPFRKDIETVGKWFLESLVRFKEAYFSWRGEQVVACSELHIPFGEDGDDQEWVCNLSFKTLLSART